MLAVTTTGLMAGDAGKGTVGKDVIVQGPFDRGSWELEGGAGFYGSFSESAAKRTTVDYELNDLRVGWMYDSPRHAGIWRGNNEFMLEALYAHITFGPGHYVAGAGIMYRYNFIPMDSKFVPYLQIGAGAVGNDIYKDPQQGELGQSFQFLLQAAVGVKYLITDQWQISTELGYRHLSDANMTEKNEGLNSVGGLVQISYMFH